MRFIDRAQAGRVLAGLLSEYRGVPGLLIFALPRGGVPVADQIAQALGAELDLLLVRKLGLPSQPELAMGAIASGGVRILNREVIETMHVSQATIDSVAAREREELLRREQSYRGSTKPAEVSGRTVIVVDDGLATGSTMLAAVRALRMLSPAKTVVAVPTAAPPVRDLVAAEVDSIVCAMSPEPFSAVGIWYEDFRPVSDEEVRGLLAAARERQNQQQAQNEPS